MRKALAVLLVALVVISFVVWRMAALTVSIGSGPIALVQQSSVALQRGGAPASVSLPVASTAGTCLVLVIGAASGASGAMPTLSLPIGWVRVAGVSNFSVPNIAAIETWVYLNNPGGIQAVSYAQGTEPTAPTWYGSMSEWANVGYASAQEASGTTTSTAGTTLTPTTTGAVVNAGDLAISAWVQRLGFGTVTFTTPTGWTRLNDDGAVSAFNHMDIEYQLNPVTGVTLGPTLTSTGTTTYAAGVIVVLEAAHPVVDETAYLAHDGISLKLNTSDFGLYLGGRYLLESSTADGYLLEDGSGVLLLDTYIPTLGDPVTFTNPTWSGRVVSVNSADIVDKLTNYNLVSVAATNSAVASATPTAPGDFSDVPAGGYFTLEDSSGRLQLEDASGLYELEGTSYGYRNLSVKTSQNQDGTVTTYGSLETFETGFAAGQAITVTSVNLGLAAVSYMITNVTTNFIGANPLTPVYLIEFGDAYQTLQAAGGGVLTKQGSTAVTQPGVVMPAGVLGYAQVTADQGTFTALTDITGLTVTVTVSSGRRIRVTTLVSTASSVSGDIVASLILEGATTLAQNAETYGSTSAFAVGIYVAAILTPTAGVHTYKVSMQRSSGTGNITMKAGATVPAFILVEDIGT